MNRTLKKIAFGISRSVAVSLLALGATAIQASSTYPNAPVSWVVPYAAGAATDSLARRLAKDMGTTLGQSFVVENQPGAGTVTAAMKLKRGAKDGYTVMSADISTLALNPALKNDLGYSPADFTLISMMARLPLVLVARSDLPVNTVTEFIDYAKKNAGSLNYASAGPGSPHHMGMELLMKQAGIEVMHIPYNGTAASMQDILAGRVDVMFGSVGAVAPHLASGKLKALGISSEKSFPELSTVQPLHVLDPRLKGYEMYAWQGLIAPAGIPAEARTKLNATLKGLLENPALVQDFAKLGLEAKWSTPEDFETYVKEQGKIWQQLVEEKKLKKD